MFFSYFIAALLASLTTLGIIYLSAKQWLLPYLKAQAVVLTKEQSAIWQPIIEEKILQKFEQLEPLIEEKLTTAFEEALTESAPGLRKELADELELFMPQFRAEVKEGFIEGVESALPTYVSQFSSKFIDKISEVSPAKVATGSTDNIIKTSSSVLNVGLDMLLPKTKK